LVLAMEVSCLSSELQTCATAVAVALVLEREVRCVGAAAQTGATA